MLRFDASHRALLYASYGGLCWLKYLIFRLLNGVYIVVGVMDYVYLCEAKVPYYGRSTYRYRAHDYASPVRNASGSRGVVGKGWSIV